MKRLGLRVALRNNIFISLSACIDSQYESLYLTLGIRSLLSRSQLVAERARSRQCLEFADPQEIQRSQAGNEAGMIHKPSRPSGPRYDGHVLDKRAYCLANPGYAGLVAHAGVGDVAARPAGHMLRAV